MSKYLEMLRALDQKKHIPGELPKLPKAPFGSNPPEAASSEKLPKPPFGSFGSNRGKRFSRRDDARPAAYPRPSLDDPERLQAETDRRNAMALRKGVTDRFCACGRLARLAWPEGSRREVWRCDDCAPTAGRA